MIPIPFGLHHFKSRSLPVSAQTCINWYPEVQKTGAKTQVALFACPGLTLFSTAGNGPIQALYEFNGTLYAVSNNVLYSINSSGTATSLGTMSGSGRHMMADNGTQLIIVNSTKAYSYTTAGGLVQITDVDYLPASTITYQDGYFIFPEDGSGNWFISELLDGTTYSSADYGTTYADPDNVVAVVADHGEVWIFGEKSVEIFYNSGAADFPFSRLDRSKVERGCIAKYSIAKMDNTLYWLGDDNAVYMANNYNPVQISDPAIEYAIQGMSTTSDAFAYAYSYEGHKFYVLTFPTGNATYVYDASTQLWHQRAYRKTTDNSVNRHRGNCYAYCYNKHFVGDFENGKIYELDDDAYTDNGDPLICETTFPTIHMNGERMPHNELYIEVESGAGLVTGQGSDPQAMLQFSDDSGRTWSNELWRSMGKIGEYRRQARWQRLGSAYDRVYRLRIADPIKRVLVAAYIR